MFPAFLFLFSQSKLPTLLHARTAAAAMGLGAARLGAWGARTVRATAAAVGPGAARRGAWGACTALGQRRRRRRGARGREEGGGEGERGRYIGLYALNI